MQVPRNLVKAALAEGRPQFGLWLASASPLVAELAGHAGFDWCLIDGEHGPGGHGATLGQLQALAATGTPAVVRVADASDWMVKQALDMGAQTLLVPMVHDGATAARIASACRYPPEGHRGMGAGMARATGFGKIAGYATGANAEICCLVQAESCAAVENIDEIAAVEGVDGVFIGPTDLSADMGFPGQPEHPEVVAAIDHVIARVVAAGKAVGIIDFRRAHLDDYLAKGVRFIGVGGDLGVLAEALKGIREGLPRN